MQAAAINQLRNHSIKPLKFNGTTQESGLYWQEKFTAYCRRASVDITDDDVLLEHYVFNWWISRNMVYAFGT